MQICFSLFCEAAKVTPDGYISMLNGGYDIIAAESFPASTYKIFLIARILVDPNECERDHEIIAQVIDPKGHVLNSKLSIPFNVKKHPVYPDRKNTMTCSFDFAGIEFTEPGDYVFQYSVDGVKIGETGLIVTRKN